MMPGDGYGIARLDLVDQFGKARPRCFQIYLHEINVTSIGYKGQMRIDQKNLGKLRTRGRRRQDGQVFERECRLETDHR